MKSRRILAAITAAAAAFSLLTPTAVSGSEAVYSITAGAELTEADFKLFAKPADVSSADEAVEYLRECMKQRNGNISVNIPLRSYSSGNEAAMDILARAVRETDKGNEGDYLRFTLKSYRADGDNHLYGKYTLYYILTYYSSAEDEKAVSDALRSVEAELACDGRSDYEKICKAYDFVTSNVKYADDFENERIFTAYGALIDKSSVCQGYSLLLYRMLKDIGIDCRILSGRSGDERHTWNMARIGDKYFLLDPTWDSLLGGTEGAFFLRGFSDFDDFSTESSHTPVYEYKEIFPDYESDEFKAAYPQAEKRFMFGDANEDGKIDGVDASFVLTCYAAMSVSDSGFSLLPVQAAAAEITGDCIIDGNDASGLLSYYALVSAGKKMSLNKYLRQYRTGGNTNR